MLWKQQLLGIFKKKPYKMILNALPNIKHLDSGQFFLVAGPCAVESKDLCFEIAEKMIAICENLQIPYIFKGSYKKANRSRLDSFTGIGDEKALNILKEVKDHFSVPVTTDVHSAQEATYAADFVDVLQIPAFLCRQTDLLISAAKTGKMVSIKKGQFMSAESMKHAVDKVRLSGNDKVCLIERGTTFGYQDLVVDFRGIPVMQDMNVPVILDCTHSLQQPNQTTGVTGGKPRYIETIAKAGIAVGVEGLFIETHPDPKNAKSDGANMLDLKNMSQMLFRLAKIRKSI